MRRAILTRYSHLLAKRPLICFMVFAAVPLSLSIPVYNNVKLSSPAVGWRTRRHETADANDALALASKFAGVSNLPLAVRNQLLGEQSGRQLLDQRFANISTEGVYVNQLHLNWWDARVWCEAYGGQLASVRSEVEDLEIQKAMRESGVIGDVWLGASDLMSESEWRWLAGDVFSRASVAVRGAYTNWANNEPNDSGGTEDCLSKYIWDEGRWNDLTCSNLNPSVCRGGDGYPPEIAVADQSRRWSTVSLGFWRSDGGNVLSERSLERMAQVEQAVARLLKEECLVARPPEAFDAAGGVGAIAGGDEATAAAGGGDEPVRRCASSSVTKLFATANAPPIDSESSTPAATAAPLLCASSSNASAAAQCVQRRLQSASRVEAMLGRLAEHSGALLTLSHALEGSESAEHTADRLSSFATALASNEALDADWFRAAVDDGATPTELGAALAMQAPFEAYRFYGAARSTYRELDEAAHDASRELYLMVRNEVHELSTLSQAEQVDTLAVLRMQLLQPERAGALARLFSVEQPPPPFHDGNASSAEAAWSTWWDSAQSTAALPTGLPLRDLTQRLLLLVPASPLGPRPASSWGLSSDFNGSSGSARAAMAELPLGYPLPGYNQTTRTSTEQWAELRLRMLTFDERLRAELKALGLRGADSGGSSEGGSSEDGGDEGSSDGDGSETLEVAWTFGGWHSWLGERVLFADLRVAGSALCLACVCICVHTRSVFLGVMGAMEIAFSFPLALYVYRMALGITLFGVLHTIG